MNISKILEDNTQNLDVFEIEDQKVADELVNEITSEMNFEDDAPVAKPKAAKYDVKPIVHTARRCMNRGMMAKEMLAHLRTSYTENEIRLATKELRNLVANEGIIGCVAIDLAGYENVKVAMKDASQSPYKKFIRSVIGYTGTPTYFAANDNKGMGEVVESSGNPIDDFCKDDKVASKMVAYSKEAMLPVIVSREDVDEQWKDSTMIDLINLGTVTKEEARFITNSKKKACEQLAAAFKLIDQKRHAKSKAIKSNAADHQVEASDMTVELESERKQASPLDVDGNAELDTIDIEKKAEDVGVELEEKRKVAVEVNEKALDVEVDEQPFEEEEFVGSNVIELDKKKASVKPLEIDTKGGFDI